MFQIQSSEVIGQKSEGNVLLIRRAVCDVSSEYSVNIMVTIYVTYVSDSELRGHRSEVTGQNVLLIRRAVCDVSSEYSVNIMVTIYVTYVSDSELRGHRSEVTGQMYY